MTHGPPSKRLFGPGIGGIRADIEFPEVRIGIEAMQYQAGRVNPFPAERRQVKLQEALVFVTGICTADDERSGLASVIVREIAGGKAVGNRHESEGPVARGA
jgi:hypothetical protein